MIALRARGATFDYLPKMASFGTFFALDASRL
jgi:hypothetical protein